MTQESDQVKIALVSVGIYCADEKIKKCQQKALDYIKKCRDKSDLNCPILDQTCLLSLICNNVSYSFKVVLYSPNEYAIICSNNYAIFKLSGKQDTSYKLFWKSCSFSVNITHDSHNNFQVRINDSDPINIQKTKNFSQLSSPIPFSTDDVPDTDKLNSVLDRCLSRLKEILNGYTLPEPFFSINLYKELDIMFTVLRDPLLPSLQFQNLLESNDFSLPAGLLNELQQIIAQYVSNYSSVFSRFSSTKILLLINNYIESISDRSTQLNMMVALRPILELAEMYSEGIRGNAKHVIHNLLENYRRVEIKFQNEDTIAHSNIVNRFLSISDVFSHNCLNEKNKLILGLIEYLESYLPGLITDLKPTIHKLLNSLSGRMYSVVISKLREILITGQIPSYEIRKNEIEAIFLNSINRYSNSLSTGRLENLIHSNSEMCDIISDFFYHKMIDLRKCALEVYIRRAYMAYEIQSFKQLQFSSGQLCVIFQYSRSTHKKDVDMPKIKRSNSFVTLNNNLINGACRKKNSQSNRRITGKCSPLSLDKDDIVDTLNNDFVSEYNVIDDKGWNLKQHDNDTDSAISIGGHSLSEMSATVSDQVDFDSIGEVFPIQYRHSPSVRSLEEIATTNKTSTASWDSLGFFKWKRASSIYSNQLPASCYEDFYEGNLDTGIMVIFNTLEELSSNMHCFNELISGADTLNSSDYLEYDFLDHTTSSPSSKIVINIALCDEELLVKSDADVAEDLRCFCFKHSEHLNDINVSRITFLLQSVDKSLRYFTFRRSRNFTEDLKVRQIDPALSFQLEINRLLNYHLERLPVLNRRMYVYLGRIKVMTMSITAEYRMFVRCIIHHNDINSSTTNIDYMAKEAEKSLVEAMDAIDIAWIDGRVNFTSSNHIFFYFHSILNLNKIEELETVVRTMVLRYGNRLWNLRITQAELKLSVKLNSDSSSLIPIRLWVHNEGGKSLDIFIYREIYQNNTDQKILMSWSPNKESRYHGVPVDCFYSV